MLFQERIIQNQKVYVKTWSDTFMIRQIETGLLYIEAIDVPYKYTYEESTTPLPTIDTSINSEEVVEEPTEEAVEELVNEQEEENLVDEIPDEIYESEEQNQEPSEETPEA